MNCWRFDARIFDACRDVPRSARGEFELPEAVGLAVERGVRFRAVPARGPVLDLSRRADATDVARRLREHRAAAMTAADAGAERWSSAGSIRTSAAREGVAVRRASSPASARHTGARPSTSGGSRAGSRSSASTPTTPAAERWSAPCRAASRVAARRRDGRLVRWSRMRGAASAGRIQPSGGPPRRCTGLAALRRGRRAAARARTSRQRARRRHRVRQRSAARLRA